MISKDRDVEFHSKGWGFEQWMANSELYCGKLLVILTGLKCSIHYHKLKNETFYLQDGLINIRVWEEPFELDLPDESDFEVGGLIDYTNYFEAYDLKMESMPEPSELRMEPGDRLIIPPNTPHQFEGIAASSTLIEISTQHFEDDSYRILKGD